VKIPLQSTDPPPTFCCCWVAAVVLSKTDGMLLLLPLRGCAHAAYDDFLRHREIDVAQGVAMRHIAAAPAERHAGHKLSLHLFSLETPGAPMPMKVHASFPLRILLAVLAHHDKAGIHELEPQSPDVPVCIPRKLLALPLLVLHQMLALGAVRLQENFLNDYYRAIAVILDSDLRFPRCPASPQSQANWVRGMWSAIRLCHSFQTELCRAAGQRSVGGRKEGRCRKLEPSGSTSFSYVRPSAHTGQVPPPCADHLSMNSQKSWMSIT
jgi:hypothetical protein